MHFACKHSQAKNTWRNTAVAVSEGLTAPPNESKYIYTVYKRKGITIKIKKKGTGGGGGRVPVQQGDGQDGVL